MFLAGDPSGPVIDAANVFGIVAPLIQDGPGKIGSLSACAVYVVFFMGIEPDL